MSLQTLSEWLRCPNCLNALHDQGQLTLACEKGHTFDVNKRGYISLLRGASGLIGDSALMLDERDRFLKAGWYDFLLHELQRVISPSAPRRIVDMGCGTGYYLSGVLPARPEAQALAVDISPAAVARTARQLASVEGLVADVWAPLPVRDASADMILNVFAPRNAEEFHRVLAPDGRLVVVIPQDDHMQELRAAGMALDVQPHKMVRLTTALAPWFDLVTESAVRELLPLPLETVRSLIGMGPSAHHHSTTELLTGAPGAVQSVTAAFSVAVFQRRVSH